MFVLNVARLSSISIVKRKNHMNNLVEIHNVSKKYDNIFAVNNASITIRENAILGFIGENGAGKTTLLKMLCGMSKPTSGSIDLLFDKSGAYSKHNIQIGSLIEAPGYYPNMTAFDNIKLKALYAGEQISDTQIKELIDLVGLNGNEKKKVKNYSLGMKQRLGIAIALVGNPPLLVLDEPINGLDPHGIVEIRNLIKKLNEERSITFVISSHILDELSKVATDYCFIHKGNILLQIPKSELEAKCENSSIEEYYLNIIEGVHNA